MNYTNSWDNNTRSASYARLEFPNTYHLAYRDLPEIIGEHTSGKKALDFGCGTGRSTRFLKNFRVRNKWNSNISASMISMAKQLDPAGDYHIVKDGKYDAVGNNYDLILSIFTFDNIPHRENRAIILSALKNLLGKNGCISYARR
ncbi:MAG: class I SAM-dependent methyltransferase [Bacteroidales bacterium]|nr:class I SAM-dependent methyltransferase [Bacteroidales bacterium]